MVRTAGSTFGDARGSFHLSLTVLCAIGRYQYFGLEGGPPCFPQGFTCLVVLWILLGLDSFSRTGLSPSVADCSKVFPVTIQFPCAVRTPQCTHCGLGSSAFARRYLRNHCCFLFLRLLRCFSSAGSRPYAMDSRAVTAALLQ